MITFNEKGAWGKVSKVLPVSIQRSELHVSQMWTSAVGVVEFADINTDQMLMTGDIDSLDKELVNAMIGEIKSNDLLVEFYGVSYFKMTDEEADWQLQINAFMKDSSNFKMTHPRRMSRGKPYLFFSRRFVENIVQKGEVNT